MKEKIIETSIRQHLELVSLMQALQADIASAADLIQSSLVSGGKVIFCGNGGSAADSQHLAAEFVGKFLLDRKPLPAVALNVNSSQITAIGNDFGFEYVFSREIEATGKPEDILVALSTSGNSQNVLNAVFAAKDIGMNVVGLTGQGGGKLKDYCDLCLSVPSQSTPRIQEMHIMTGHIICEAVEAELC